MGNEFQEGVAARIARAQTQIAARQLHRENMMALVLNSLTRGDHAGATAAARDAYGMDNAEEEKVRDLFYLHAPAAAPCPECGKPIPWEVNDRFQYRQNKCQSCAYAAIMAEKEKRLPELLRACGVPQRYHDACMSDFSENYRKMDLDRGYFFSGKPGTGKTHLLAAMFKKTVLDMQPELYTPESRTPWRHPVYSDFTYPMPHYDNDFPVFISAPELLVSIKATFNQRDGLTEKDIIDKYSEAAVLFLDDLGAEYSTEWATGVMFLLIDRRYNAQLRTHITSNLSLEELAGRLNDRVTSRIAGMCHVVKMSGRDRRLGLVRAA